MMEILQNLALLLTESLQQKTVLHVYYVNLFMTDVVVIIITKFMENLCLKHRDA